MNISLFRQSMIESSHTGSESQELYHLAFSEIECLPAHHSTSKSRCSSRPIPQRAEIADRAFMTPRKEASQLGQAPIYRVSLSLKSTMEVTLSVRARKPSTSANVPDWSLARQQQTRGDGVNVSGHGTIGYCIGI
jgi:hypothetical protein